MEKEKDKNSNISNINIEIKKDFNDNTNVFDTSKNSSVKKKLSDLSISEEIAYLRLKNLKLKQKSKLNKENLSKILEEKSALDENYYKITSKLSNEKKVRKQIEEQLLEIFKKEIENKKIKENLIAENESLKQKIKTYENEIVEVKNNFQEITNNNLNNNRNSLNFSSEIVEIKPDSFSINSCNNPDVFSNNNKNLNKNLALINGVNLKTSMEENFFRTSSHTVKNNNELTSCNSFISNPSERNQDGNEPNLRSSNGKLKIK